MNKLVYIAHPLTSHGDEKINRKRVNTICKTIMNTEPNIVPISPIHAFSFYPATGSQDKVMQYCKHLLLQCQEIRLYGEWWHSIGCKQEIQIAQQAKITIIPITVPPKHIALRITEKTGT